MIPCEQPTWQWDRNYRCRECWRCHDVLRRIAADYPITTLPTFLAAAAAANA